MFAMHDILARRTFQLKVSVRFDASRQIPNIGFLPAVLIMASIFHHLLASLTWGEDEGICPSVTMSSSFRKTSTSVKVPKYK